MNFLRMFSLSAISVLATAIAGCGYHTAAHYSTLPKSIHVIAVPPMENQTTGYRIEQRLTAATIHEFLAKTTFRVVSDADAGDAVLRGKVVSLEIVPLLYNNETTASGQQTAQATAMLIIIKCDVSFTDRTTQKVLYHNNNYIFRNEYELSTDVRSFFQEGDPAVDRMAKDFASRLVSAVTENY
ncbi:MAG TPA: LPS assembly lipoprotein LptE [Candidatus Acidoferrum sp.]|nr:LPS assembly lipoprotein LptE [Candidatus Acidoferrum sp.]